MAIFINQEGIMVKISDVIEFAGNVDDLVWKSPVENFNTTSVLIVDETHQALVLVNGTQYGLYGPGRHVLETPNIPAAKRIINIPSGGKTSFPCKVFYVNMVHQMAMEWGVPGNIKLEDPVYQVFMDIGARGTIDLVVTDCIKFLEKLVGFRDRFDSKELTNLDNGKFRGIINKWVTSDISKIMISGGVSYFTISENLFEISEVVKEQLSNVFAEYGVGVQDFVIEAIVAGSDNYQALAEAKRLHASRRIQGYTWQEERKMAILDTAAGNPGVMGGMQGAVGGFMMGGAVGGSLTDMLRGVLNGGNGESGEGAPRPGTLSGTGSYKTVDPVAFLTQGAGKPGQIQTQNGAQSGGTSSSSQPAQPSGVSFANPQPAQPAKPSGVSFANPQPAQPAQPSGTSFANPQPAQPAQPSGVSFANPQPVQPAKPSGTSFANPQPVQPAQPSGFSFAGAAAQDKKEEKPVQPAPVKKTEPVVTPAPTVEEKPETGAPQNVECNNCHRMIPAIFKFCPYCGNENEKKCPHCGRVVSDEFAFCPGCGHKL